MIKDFNKFLLLEKEIIVGYHLEKKLKRINNDLAKDILNFLKSDNIRDDIKIDKVDLESDDNKTITTAYDNKKRKYKVGKLLQMLGYDLDRVNVRELEDIVLHLKKTQDELVLVKGEEIRDVYLVDNYEEGGGYLNSSCMRHEKCQKYLDIYVENPEVCSCLVLYNDEGKVRGRALLQKLTSGKLYMDRVYLSNTEYKPVFLKYCEDNGIYYNYDNKLPNLDVELSDYVFDYYPYMDTFMYLCGDSLMNYFDSDDYGAYCLQSTSGGYEELFKCAVSGKFYSLDDLVYIEAGTYYDDYIYKDYVVCLMGGEYCYDGDAIEITVGRHSGEFVLKDSDEQCDLNYQKYEGEIAYREYCVEVTCGSLEGEQILEEDSIYLNYGVYEFEEGIAFDADCVKVDYGKYKGEWILDEDSIETENGIEYKDED